MLAQRDLAPAAPAAQGETGLARALRESEWVVSIELDPPQGGNNEGMLAVARRLAESGRVGFVDINDNPMARARMNALMAAVAIERARDRDDPARHPARHDGDGARVGAARRTC